MHFFLCKLQLKNGRWNNLASPITHSFHKTRTSRLLLQILTYFVLLVIN